MARNNRSYLALIAIMGAFTFSLLALLQVVGTVFAFPPIGFRGFRGSVQRDGQVPFEEQWEARRSAAATGQQYLLGVGKADITG